MANRSIAGKTMMQRFDWCVADLQELLTGWLPVIDKGWIFSYFHNAFPLPAILFFVARMTVYMDPAGHILLLLIIAVSEQKTAFSLYSLLLLKIFIFTTLFLPNKGYL